MFQLPQINVPVSGAMVHVTLTINALVPQVTGLAMSLGSIFNGAIITEQVFGYPGIGTLLISAVHTGDYGLVIGIASVSIIAVSVCVLVIDLLYPLLDPRIKVG